MCEIPNEILSLRLRHDNCPCRVAPHFFVCVMLRKSETSHIDSLYFVLKKYCIIKRNLSMNALKGVSMQIENTKGFEKVKIMLFFAFIVYVFVYGYPLYYTHYLFLYDSVVYDTHLTPIVVNISYLIYAALMIVALNFFAKKLQNNRILFLGFLYLLFNYALIFLYFISDFIFSAKSMFKNAAFFEYGPLVMLVCMVVVYAFFIRECTKNSRHKMFKILCFVSAILQSLALLQMFYFGLKNNIMVLKQSALISMVFEILALGAFILACWKLSQNTKQWKRYRFKHKK